MNTTSRKTAARAEEVRTAAAAKTAREVREAAAEKTARLRALRLAKEATDHAPEPDAPVSSAELKPTRRALKFGL